MTTANQHQRSADHPADADGRQYHIGLAPGEVAPWILLVGDPARAERVAASFETVALERRHREYVGFTGTQAGLPITVLGTGMGPDNTEIAVVELCACAGETAHALTILRCGSCGALQDQLHLGDLVITQGAYRLENTSLAYVGEGYPAVADPLVVLAAVQAAEALRLPWHVGLTATAPGFYGAQGRAIHGFPPRAPDRVAELRRQGVLNLEMEASCLLTLGTLRGFRAGAICAVFAERGAGSFVDDAAKERAERGCIEAGLLTLRNLAALDARRRGARLWHPGLP